MENKDYIKNIEGAERRMVTIPIEFREEGEEKYFEGTGIVFNSTTDMGWYTEEVAPEALDEVMNDDVRGLFNHDQNIVLGRTKSGTMALSKDSSSAKFKIKYNESDPDHVRVYQKVKRGDVSGCSFAFNVKDDEWSTRNGKDHRRILRLKEWYDIGPVTYPAYESTTVAARSFKNVRGEDYKKDLAEMELQKTKRQLNEMKR
jgi:HK97 family phage prohead protease